MRQVFKHTSHLLNGTVLRRGLISGLLMLSMVATSVLLTVVAVHPAEAHCASVNANAQCLQGKVAARSGWESHSPYYPHRFPHPIVIPVPISGGIPGPQGPTGPQGPQGPQGIPGPTLGYAATQAGTGVAIPVAPGVPVVTLSLPAGSGYLVNASVPITFTATNTDTCVLSVTTGTGTVGTAQAQVAGGAAVGTTEDTATLTDWVTMDTAGSVSYVCSSSTGAGSSVATTDNASITAVHVTSLTHTP